MVISDDEDPPFSEISNSQLMKPFLLVMLTNIQSHRFDTSLTVKS
jgi:hypothetical protein